MRLRLPRGQRRVVTAAFVLAALPIAWHLVRTAREAPRPLDPSRPVEGVTSELAREVPVDHPPLGFEDVTARSGIRFVHSRGTRGHLLPEDMGPGCGWIDLDGDGWIDLFIANDTGPFTGRTEPAPDGPTGALYRNRGDGTFDDVSTIAGVATRDDGYGVSVADIDNDGYPDIHLGCFGPGRLFRNHGDGTFEDVGRRAGVQVPVWTLASAFGDYDRDGWVDLYVGRYVRFAFDPALAGRPSVQGARNVPYTLNPSSFDAVANVLFRNRHDGRFEDVTAAAGVANADGKSLQVVFADLDSDRWPDIYVGNDVTNNALLRNRGDGRFDDQSASSWTADVRASMGIAVGDLDGDGDLDMFLTHWVAQENALYKNLWVESGRRGRPRLTFMDLCDALGLGQSSLDFVKWGTDFIDVNDDGELDLFVAQGSTLEDDTDPTRLVKERPMLYWNRGGDRGFYDVSSVSGEVFGRALDGRGAAMGDFDADGGVDIALTQNRGPAVLLRNTSARGHSLDVELVGTLSNRSALGARVVVTVGRSRRTKELGAGGSYLSSHATVVHFGLGQARVADRVEVLWPSGRDSVLLGVPAGRRVRVVEPASGGPLIRAAKAHAPAPGPTTPATARAALGAAPP